jgi:hypothetical protein
VRAAATGLLEVGCVGPDAMRIGVKEEGIEIRQPEPTGQKGGEQEQGTKAATTRSDHARTLRKGSGFVYWLNGATGNLRVSELVRKCFISWPPRIGEAPYCISLK